VGKPAQFAGAVIFLATLTNTLVKYGFCQGSGIAVCANSLLSALPWFCWWKEGLSGGRC